MTRDELLAGVVDAPNDDGPRLVYADWLLQQDDPIDRARGEYISLAVSPARSPKRTARLAELLDKYEATWLGPVHNTIDDRRRTWNRGFLEACALHRQPRIPATNDLGSVIGHPAWRTLRTLEMFGSPLSIDAQLSILRQNELVNLRSLYAYQTCIAAIPEIAPAFQLTELAVAPAGPPLADLIALIGEPCLARLRRLHLFGCSPETGCAFSRPELTLIAIAGPNTLASWIAQLNATRATFDEVRLVSSVFPLMSRQGIELVIQRTVADRWSVLEVRWDDGNEPRLRDNVILELGRLPENVISHLQLIGPPTARFDVNRWKQRVRAALVPRQAGLVIG